MIGASSNLSESEATLEYSLDSLAGSGVSSLASEFSGQGADHELKSVTASFY